jgi:hypothetical protein
VKPHRARAIASALALALVTTSAPAAADIFNFTSSSKDPGHFDFMAWFATSMLAGAALVPHAYAIGAFVDGKPTMSRAAGAGTLVAGGLLGIGDVVALGFMDPDDGSTAITLLGGPLWSMAGVGMGRVATDQPRAMLLGGSLGFTTFATIHGIFSTAGYSDHPAANVVQSIHAAIGGTGCFVDVAYSSGVERGVAIGCGVLSAAAFLHGVVKAARGDITYRRKPAHRRALVPSPWLSRDAAGLALSGAF